MTKSFVEQCQMTKTNSANAWRLIQQKIFSANAWRLVAKDAFFQRVLTLHSPICHAFADHSSCIFDVFLLVGIFILDYYLAVLHVWHYNLDPDVTTIVAVANIHARSLCLVYGIMHKWSNPHFDNNFEKKSRCNMKYRIKRMNKN